MTEVVVKVEPEEVKEEAEEEEEAEAISIFALAAPAASCDAILSVFVRSLFNLSFSLLCFLLSSAF